MPPDVGANDRSPPAGPWSGEVLEVTGRGSDGTRGLPPAHSMTVTGPDGQDMTFGPAARDEGKRTRVYVFGATEVRNFGMCPICGSTEDLTREHVPQHDLGGTVMTYTCGPCNNGLGSSVEDELRHWFDDAIFDVRFSGGDVPGRRTVPRILLRPDSEGRVGMIFDAGKIDPTLDAILTSGTGQIEYSVPNPRMWRVAALKHAYLAACLALGEVPDTDHAAAVRGVLVATRDRERGELPPETGLSKGSAVGAVAPSCPGPDGAAGCPGGRRGPAQGLRVLVRWHAVCLVAAGRVTLLGGRPKARGCSARGELSALNRGVDTQRGFRAKLVALGTISFYTLNTGCDGVAVARHSGRCDAGRP